MLFSSDEEGKKELASLNRNELIALVNTAAQLAKSVGSVPEWRWLGKKGYTRVFIFRQYRMGVDAVEGTVQFGSARRGRVRWWTATRRTGLVNAAAVQRGARHGETGLAGPVCFLPTVD